MPKLYDKCINKFPPDLGNFPEKPSFPELHINLLALPANYPAFKDFAKAFKKMENGEKVSDIIIKNIQISDGETALKIPAEFIEAKRNKNGDLEFIIDNPKYKRSIKKFLEGEKMSNEEYYNQNDGASGDGDFTENTVEVEADAPTEAPDIEIPADDCGEFRC